MAQLENLDDIQQRRIKIWNGTIKFNELGEKQYVCLPYMPEYATNNAHMFYLVCNGIEQRTALINKLKEQGVLSVFHYLSLHKSPYYSAKYSGDDLINSDRYSDCLLRLPMYYELGSVEIKYICDTIINFSILYKPIDFSF